MLESDSLKLFSGPADAKSTAPKSEYSLSNARLIVKDNPKHEHYFEIQLAGKAEGQFLRFSAPSQIALLEWLSRLERGRDKKIIPGLVIDRGPLSDPEINGSFSPVAMFSPPASLKRSTEQIEPVPKMASISDVALGMAKAMKKDTTTQLDIKTTSDPILHTKPSSTVISTELPVTKITSLAGAALGLAKAVTLEAKESGVGSYSETRIVDKLKNSIERNEREEEVEFETPLTPIHESNSAESSEKTNDKPKHNGSNEDVTSSLSPLVSPTITQQNLRNSLGLSPMPASLEKSREQAGDSSPNSRFESSGLSASDLNMTVMQSPPVTLKLSTATVSHEGHQTNATSFSILESSTPQQISSGSAQVDDNSSGAVSFSISPKNESSPLQSEADNSANRLANRPASPEADSVASDWQQQERFQHDIKKSHHVEDDHVALFMSDEIMSGLLYLFECRDGRLGHLTERWVPRFALLETATFNGQERPDGTGSGAILRLYTQTGPTDLRESEMIQVSISRSEAIPRRPKSPRTTSCFIIKVENGDATYVLASPLSGDHSREEWISNLNDPPAPKPRQIPEKLLPLNATSLTQDVIQGKGQDVIQDTLSASLIQEKGQEEIQQKIQEKIEPTPEPPIPIPPPPLLTSKVTKLAPSLPSHPLFAAAAATAAAASTPSSSATASSSAAAASASVMAKSYSQTIENAVVASASTTTISNLTTPVSSSIAVDDKLLPAQPAQIVLALINNSPVDKLVPEKVVSSQPPLLHVSKPLSPPAIVPDLANSVLQFSGLDFDDLDDLEDNEDKTDAVPAEIEIAKTSTETGDDKGRETTEEESKATSPRHDNVPGDRKASLDLNQQSPQVNVFSPSNQDSKVFSPSNQDSKVFSPMQQDSKVFSPSNQERSSFDMDMMYPISPPSLLSTTSEASQDKIGNRNADVGEMAVEEIETVEAIMLIDDSRLESPTPDFPISPTAELVFTSLASASILPKVKAAPLPPPQSFSPFVIPSSPGTQSFYSAGGQLGEDDDEESKDFIRGSPLKSVNTKEIPRLSRNSTLLKPTAASQSRVTETKKMFDSHANRAASPSRSSIRSLSPTSATKSSNSSFRTSHHRSSASPSPSAHRNIASIASPSISTRLQNSSENTATSPIVSSPPSSARRRLVQRGQGSPVPEIRSAKRLVDESPFIKASPSFDPFSDDFQDTNLPSQQPLQQQSALLPLSKSNEVEKESSIAAARHAAAEAAIAELFGKPIKTPGSTKSEEKVHHVHETGFPRYDALKKLDVDAISQRISKIGANLELESKQQHFDESIIYSTISSSARSVDLLKDAGPVSKQIKSSLVTSESSGTVTRGRRVQRRGGIKSGVGASRSPSKGYPKAYGNSSSYTESHISVDGGRSRGRSISSVPAAGATREARAAAETVIRSYSQSRSPQTNLLKSPYGYGDGMQHLVPTVLLGGVSGSEKYIGGNSVSRTQRAISIERARAKIRGTVLVQRGKGEALRPEWKGGRW
jgi:hypothetical protein